MGVGEGGVDRGRERRVGGLNRVILGVLLRGPAPRGNYFDIAHEHPQVRGLLVRGRLGGDEARFDIERERPDGADEGAVFATGEGTDLSHDDLHLLSQARNHRGLDGDHEAPGRPTRSRQARSAAEDGRERSCCFARKPTAVVGGGERWAKRERITASGSLNGPRCSSGGTTAWTASSFSEGSIRK